MLLVMGCAAITRKDLFSNYQEPEMKESTINTVFSQQNLFSPFTDWAWWFRFCGGETNVD